MSGRIAGGLAVLLAAGGLAQAGPVAWGYSSTLEPVGGAPWYPGVVTTLQSIHGQYVSSLSGELGGTRYGWQTVTVGTIHPTDGGGDPLADIATTYQLTLTITDAASGEFGVVWYTGSAGEDAVWVGNPPFQQPINRHAYAGGLTPEGDQTLTLGGHEYRVTLHARSHPNGNAYLDAEVRVGAVSETPEPGTLLLGGLAAAGGVGAWWRRRYPRRGASSTP